MNISVIPCKSNYEMSEGNTCFYRVFVKKASETLILVSLLKSMVTLDLSCIFINYFSTAQLEFISLKICLVTEEKHANMENH